jgi:hypothetical protein
MTGETNLDSRFDRQDAAGGHFDALSRYIWAFRTRPGGISGYLAANGGLGLQLAVFRNDEADQSRQEDCRAKAFPSFAIHDQFPKMATTIVRMEADSRVAFARETNGNLEPHGRHPSSGKAENELAYFRSAQSQQSIQ